MLLARRLLFPLIGITLILSFTVSPLFASLPGSFWPTIPTVAKTSELTLSGLPATRVSGLFNAETGAPIRVGGGLTYTGLKGTLSSSDVLSFIDSNPDLFHISAPDLEILHFGDVLGKTFFTARQTIDGRPVLGTTILLRITDSGKVPLWGADVFDDETRMWRSSITAQTAADALAGFAGTAGYNIDTIRQVWVRRNGDIAPAYRIRLAGESPDEAPLGLVDARNGDILGYYNDIAEAEISGVVRGPVLPIRYDDTPVMTEFPNQVVLLDGDGILTDAEGFYQFNLLDGGMEYSFSMLLRGPWVQVIYEDGENAAYTDNVIAPEQYSPDWLSPQNGRTDEFNVFYHTNFIHQYYKELDPDFDSLDYPVPATVAYDTNYDNAFWSGYAMFFGSGGAVLHNLALFSDVIYHEYTHGVTGAIYSNGYLPYFGESGALNEAWSDYFPCSIHDYPTLSPGIYIGVNNQPLRNLDNNNHYPEDIVNEVHTDGLIVGGSMWDVREMLGAEICDSLFHYARYGLANNFIGFLEEVLVADDDDGDLSNGTPHSEEIYAGFGQHGIGPSEIPNLVIEDLQISDDNGDGELWAGETVEISFSLLNDVYLFPPPAQNVTVSGQDLEFIEWSTPEVTLDEIPAGQSVPLPQPLTFTVLENAPTLHVDLELTITANDGGYQEIIPVRLTFGNPRILLVDDCDEPSYFNELDMAIREIPTAANYWNENDGLPSSERMNEHDMVIWFTGDNRDPLSAEEIQAMREFTDAGGDLLLTGQYIGPQLAFYPEFSALLGVNESIDSLYALAVEGIEGQPASEGILSALIGPSGAGNQVAPSGIIPAPSALPLYNYYGLDVLAAVWNQLPDDGNAMYFGFGIEAVSRDANSDPPGEILARAIDALGIQLGVEDTQLSADTPPLDFALSAPYPNPFNPVTRVRYALPRSAQVRLAVYNLLGQEVLTVVNGVRAAGNHEALIDLNGTATGIYLILLETPQRTIVRKSFYIR